MAARRAAPDNEAERGLTTESLHPTGELLV
jgi:hypothetical protein